MNVVLLAVFLALVNNGEGAEQTSLVTASISQEFASVEACKNAGRELSALARGARFNVIVSCVPHDVGKVDVVPKKQAVPKDKNDASGPRPPQRGVIDEIVQGGAMRTKGVGGLVPDSATADMSCLCIWQNAMLKEPRVQGDYIVELDTPAIGRRLAMLWFSPTLRAGDRWRNLKAGEYVTHWLQGLREPNDLLRSALLERQGRPR